MVIVAQSLHMHCLWCNEQYTDAMVFSRGVLPVMCHHTGIRHDHDRYSVYRIELKLHVVYCNLKFSLRTIVYIQHRSLYKIEMFN